MDKNDLETDWGDSQDDFDGEDWEQLCGDPEDDGRCQYFGDTVGDSGIVEEEKHLDRAANSIKKKLASANSIISVALDNALKQHDLKLLKELLDGGMDVDHRRPGGRTALMRAANNDEEDLAKILLAYGADPQAVDDAYDSPIRTALKKRTPTTFLLVHALLERSLKDYRLSEADLDTPYSLIPDEGYYFPNQDVEALPDTRTRKSLLEWAAEFEHEDVFDQAIRAGCDVFGKFSESTTPNIHSSYERDTEDDDTEGGEKDPVMAVVLKRKNIAIATCLYEARNARLEGNDPKLDRLAPNERDFFDAQNGRLKAWLSGDNHQPSDIYPANVVRLPF